MGDFRRVIGSGFRRGRRQRDSTPAPDHRATGSDYDIIPVRVQCGDDAAIEFVVVGATGLPVGTGWRLDGRHIPAGLVPLLERWCSGTTGLMLCVDPTGHDASLFGPSGCITGLHLLDRNGGGRLPLNTVRLGTGEFLRVMTRYGDGVHLAAPTPEPADARPATGLRPRRRAGWELAGYDRASLTAPRWDSRTLCGLQWWRMASHAVETVLLGRGEYMCGACSRLVAAPRP